MKIFYSWQSDLPNSTNRNLIGKALENAVKALSGDPHLDVEPVIDRDVMNTPGAANIADTILSKIDCADVIVSDVSIIGQVNGRKTPNPNVVFELGYAFRSIGAARVILVMNTVYGVPEDLPFDLRMKSVITYNCKESDDPKAPARNSLQARVEGALKTIIEHAPPKDAQGKLVPHDEALFNAFREAMPSNRSIEFIRENNFAGFSFDCRKLSDLDEFYYVWNDAEHKFVNKELEELRNKLHSAVTEFLDLIGGETFPAGHQHFNTVPPEWEHTQPKRFFEVVDRLHKLAKSIVQLHQSLIQKGIAHLSQSASN